MIIYRWIPHGSRNLSDLLPLEAYKSNQSLPHLMVTTQPMICHDQEPLNYNYWSKQDFENFIVQFADESPAVAAEFAPWHLRAALPRLHRAHVFGYTLLCHSEMNSHELAAYENNNFLGVYYWSHALIARDWFRYAQIDRSLSNKNIVADFLIYNRAWAGTREYRLKMAELLIENNLVQHCRTKFNPVDQYHYCQHQFINPALAIQRTDIHTHFDHNDYDASASADYDSSDYRHTAIEVVLETLFDDSRWHLTEKTLRPIACGQPFILVGTPGSLQYLRHYGFKTYNDVFDESYDTIQDPRERLEAIVKLMSNIANNPDKNTLYLKCQEIAQYNQRHFFSEDFFNTVVSEFTQNFDAAYSKSLQQVGTQRLEQCWAAIKRSGDYYRRADPAHLASVDAQRRYVYDFVQKVKDESMIHPNLPAVG